MASRIDSKLGKYCSKEEQYFDLLRYCGYGLLMAVNITVA